MKTIICFLFLLSSLVWADVAGYVGGTSADPNNGGWGAASLAVASVTGANGAVLDIATGATISDNGSGNVRLTSASAFDDAAVGVYAYCDFSATYTDGRYAILAVDATDNYIDIDLEYISNVPTAYVRVGGAVTEAELPNIMDVIGHPSDPGTQTENVYIYFYDGGDGYARTVQWDIDVGGSSTAAYRRYLIGVNSAYVEDGTLARVYASDAMTYLIDLTVHRQVYRNIDFDGVAMTTSHAIYCTGVYADFQNCTIRRGGGMGFYGYMGAYPVYMMDCTIRDNAGNGIGFYGGHGDHSRIINCTIRDNGGSGINPGDIMYILNNLIDGNTSYGIQFQSSAWAGIVANNTIHGNGSGGMEARFTAGAWAIYNNTMANNGGYGYKDHVNAGLTGLFFAHNHSYNNTSGHTNLTGTWADLGCGGNITGDPLFTDAVNGDFEPQSGSPLINAGMLDRTIGAKEPTYPSGGAGGGLLSPIIIGN